MALGEFDGGDVELTKEDRIRMRADEVADKAMEKAANERKSGSEARKDSSEARKRFLGKASRMVGGGGGAFPDTEKVPGKRPLKFKKGGIVKSSASKRGDGCATKGKTKGRMV